MSETLDEEGAGTSRQRYRLRAPDRRAFDPTQLELLTQQQIAQPDGGQLLGYQLLARTRAANAQNEYMEGLQQSNAMQARLSANEQAGQLTRAILASRNPGLAYNLLLARQTIAPDRMENMRDWADIEQAGALAEVANEGAQANQRNADAGVLPPPGTVFDRYSLPTRPRVQGTPPAMMRGAGGGGSSGRQDPQWARLYSDVERDAEAQRGQLERTFLQDRGVADLNGNIIRPEAVTPQMRAEMRAYTEQRLAAMRDARFALIDRQRGLPEGTTRSFVQSQAPRPSMPDAPVGPTAPPANPAIVPPNVPQQPRPAQVRPPASQLTREQDLAIQRAAPPGARRFEHNPVTGRTVYFDANNNVVGTR
jgi:hypothetical protein